ncbi:TauD/TfdA family dioxygenase [Burkholderia sp. Bp8992]|uniref:TauD/TfdA dioxygenase family protein n=1 Tax=Burkholderia sp. Bp8992 TaxID=2184554 RepID=UPI001624569A|nr:TauD/TfdA family dioxygenase [Burkholderia sp. Bp8992]
MIATKKRRDGFGAEIHGFDVEAASDGEIAALRNLLLEHEVIFIKGCNVLGPQAYRTFSERFWGSLVHPFSSTEDPIVPGISPFQPYEGFPEITGIYHGKNNKGNLNEWHSDLNWLANPSFGSILQAVEVPAYGGDTLWASTTRAFDDMPVALKSRCEGRAAFHDFTQIYRGIFKDNHAALAEAQRRFPAIRHPIFMTHPKTGRTTVFVNRVSTTHIDEMALDESRAILEEVYRWVSKPEFQVRHTWEQGDIAIWDNLATQHYAISDYFPQERKMHRISLRGVEV